MLAPPQLQPRDAVPRSPRPPQVRGRPAEPRADRKTHPAAGSLMLLRMAAGSRHADAHEREADRAAAEASAPAGRAPTLSFTAGPPARSAAPPLVQEVVRAAGEPLDARTRAGMESRFGRSFESVRVHADDRAGESARSVSARAYTVGRHLVFGTGAYAPGTEAGHRLLAHELAHVVQQERAGAPADPGGGDVALQRTPQDEDEMHRPMIDEYRRQHGYPPGGVDENGQRVGPTDGEIKYRLGLGAVAQKGPGTAPAKLTPAQVYAGAVTRIQSEDAILHGILSQVTLGGSNTTVRTLTVKTADTPPVDLTMVFNLKVVTNSALPAGTLAQFPTPSPVITPGAGGTTANFTADMVIEVNPTSGPSAVTDLATNLYHEGLHMLIFMDGFLPTGRSPHGAALAKYSAVAQKHPDLPTVQTEIEALLKSTIPAARLTKVAKEMVGHLVEEKYVIDQEKKHFGTTASNGQIALTYVVDLLTKVGVKVTATDPAVVKLAKLVVVIYDAIDAALAPAATPTPPPKTP